MDSESEIKGLVREADLESAGPLVTYYVKPRRLGMNIVSNQELEDLGSTSLEGSLYFTLLGIAAGGLITSAAAIAIGGILNPYVFASFVAALLVSLLGTICFGALSYVSMKKARERINLIKKESLTREAELLG